MVSGFSTNAMRSAPGSVLARLLERTTPHPDTFVGGIRWPPAAKWRYRRMWVDPLKLNGVTSVRFSPKEGVEVRLDPEPLSDVPAPAARPGMTVLSCQEARSGAPVQLAVPDGQLGRFGIDRP